MRKKIIVLLTFLGGLYYFLDFVVPEKLPFPPELDSTGVLIHNGGEKAEDGWVKFPDLNTAAKVAGYFKVQIPMPPPFETRPARMRLSKFQMIVEVDKTASDDPNAVGLWSATDGKWRFCGDAVPLTLDRLGLAMGGVFTADRSAIQFKTAREAIDMASEMNAKIEVPKSLDGRTVTVRKFKAGKWLERAGVTLEVAAQPTDTSEGKDGWKLVTEKWNRGFSAPLGFDDIKQLEQEFTIKADDQQRFNFKEADTALKAVQMFGFTVTLPDALLKRPAWLQRQKDKLVVGVNYDPSDAVESMTKWHRDGGDLIQSCQERPRIMHLKGRALSAGAEFDADGNLVFNRADSLAAVVSEFGIIVDVPKSLVTRKATLSRNEGEIKVSIEGRQEEKLDDADGWELGPALWTKTYVTYRYVYFSAYNEEVFNALSIIGALAIGLGFINIFMAYGVNIILRRKGWINSVALFVAMFVTLIAGFWNWSNDLTVNRGISISVVSTHVGLFFMNVIRGIGGLLTGLSSAIFSLLAVYIVAAAYRTFRIKSGEAALMMLAALLVMVGQIPLGGDILDKMFQWVGIGGAGAARQWVMNYINSPVFRAIAFGAGVAGLIMALRMWFSMDASTAFSEKEK